MAKPKIAIILGSTRDHRFCPVPGQWIFDLAKKRGTFDVELVDLKDFDLPFFNEMASNNFMPSSDPKAIAWQNKIDSFDGYIFVVAEYNYSITAALKNALDQASKNWARKPAAYFGYGGVGAARAIEHLRLISVSLRMVPVRDAVNIGGAEFIKVFPAMGNQPMSSIEEVILPSANALLDDLTWWVKATMSMRVAQ